MNTTDDWSGNRVAGHETFYVPDFVTVNNATLINASLLMTL